MRRFIERAMAKVPRMSEDQMRALLYALAEENGRMEVALDSMLDGIVVCDNDHLPIIYNKTAERMLRLGGPDPSERPLWLAVEDEELARFLKATLEGEDSVLDREFRLESKGSVRLVAASVTPLVSRGRIQGALLHLEDITEKRKREAQLRRAESLASLTTLAAGVAHEIKNPLGAISIHIQLIKKAALGKAGLDPAILERHLGVVDEEIERLNKIVVDFLFAVRPMDVQLIETDPGELVREIADFMGPEAERAGVSLELELDEGLPRVLLDRRYMKQAILNLVKNALAAMPGGGRLVLSARAGEDGVEISVEDSGVGIAEEDLAKIFEPYFTTRENGTGLGLTITFKIVKEHRGEISVSSRQGQGSIFTISLPVPQKVQRLLAWDEDPSLGEEAGDTRKAEA
ncbi:MAG TPA: ATP-binding protein [Rectinemataceae bacterium]|nr:ATP-binding protein [Rectinemataceae bacterium]